MERPSRNTLIIIIIIIIMVVPVLTVNVMPMAAPVMLPLRIMAPIMPELNPENIGNRAMSIHEDGM